MLPIKFLVTLLLLQLYRVVSARTSVLAAFQCSRAPGVCGRLSGFCQSASGPCWS